MTSFFRSLSLFVIFSSSVQAQGAVALDTLPAIVRAADKDGSGVSAQEWTDFKARLVADAQLDGGAAGTLDRPLVLTMLMSGFWDSDSDGVLTALDFDLLYKRLNVDQGMSAAFKATNEISNSVLQAYSLALLLGISESEGDRVITREEWSVFSRMAEGEAGAITLKNASVWIDEAIAAPPPADKNAVTVGVYLLTLDAALDADFSGAVDMADFDQIFAAFDRDQSGELSSAEIEMGPVVEAQKKTPRTRRAELAGPIMPWQRNLKDALAISKRTGKPLLICVNIDDESASETLARYQYQDPNFVKLVEGFVPILASPASHSPREHNDRGQRLPDPKFGRLISSEHIDNEPELYARYFGGTRVAPRHVGVSPDGQILFDLKLLNDLSVIDRMLSKFGVVVEASQPRAEEATEQDLLNSPDALFRDQLESMFAKGDVRTRVRLASLCLSSARDVQHSEILRMALLDEDRGVRSQAVWTAIQHSSLVPTDLLLSAITAAGDQPDELRVLLDAVGRVAIKSKGTLRGNRANRLQRVFTALSQKSEVMDVDRWKLALSFAPQSAELAPAEAQIGEVSRRLSDLESRLKVTPEDRELNLLFADTMMRMGRIQLLSGGNPTYLFEDSRRAAALALKADPTSGTALGYMAWSNYQLSDPSAVDYAAQALPYLREAAGSPLASHVLQVFAQTRLAAFYSALAENREWSPESIADICAVHEVLLGHPAVTEAQTLGYVGFLATIEAHALQADVVRRSLALFPGSVELHRRLRDQTLRDSGAKGLEALYAGWDVAAEYAASYDWYAGRAALMAAERNVQNQLRTEALGAYESTVKLFRDSFEQNPAYKPSADYYIAQALAGSARLHTDGGSWDSALDAIHEGFSLSPGSLTENDGLGNSPADTAKRLHRALIKEGRATEASVLRRLLDDRGI
ncbi:MAG: tetratricopeptide (TPR) repeat protein [Planctomycetota bacterium]|jgi:tetratricopeptide (TPR) repeat protein